MQTQTSKLEQLKKKHLRFSYDSYEYHLVENKLVIKFTFTLEPNITFAPQITINHVSPKQLESFSKAQLDTFVFHLGLMEIPSYWKAACSPQIIVKAGSLNTDQIKWWHDLLIKGLGEFFYTNNIDFTQEKFIEILSQGPTISTPKSDNKSQLKTESITRIMVPLGGGKDSAVTLESLKNNPSHQKQELFLFALNPTEATKTIIAKNSTLPILTATRKIDRRLLELNEQGYLNGHTPFSAYLAFLTTFVARLHQIDFIAVSNESSASECNTTYKGHPINHQYSKSFDFEQKLQQYAQTYLQIDNNKFAQYFSYLRPLHELQIARIFAHLGRHYFTDFKSCNVGSKENVWCHHCPKCLFAFLMLFPFIDTQTLTSKIFNHNLFENPELLEIAFKLVSPDETKPFECVGSYEESLVAFYLAIKKYQQQDKPLPVILEKIEAKIIAGQPEVDQRAQTILQDWNQQHSLPSFFEPKVGIYGLGREGQSTQQYLQTYYPHLDQVLLDQKPSAELSQQVKDAVSHHPKTSFIQVDPSNLQPLSQFKVVYKSAGISPFNKEISQLRQKGVHFSSSTQLFFNACPGKIIGITGTKGKSTTTALIHHVLSATQKDVRLAGNIGIPMLETLETSTSETIFVLELSSHQLLDLTKSPHIAVIQAIRPEHLDYYHNFDAYVDAKATISKYQSGQDFLIYNADSDVTSHIAQNSTAQKLPYGNDTVGELFNLIGLNPEEIPLKGTHNYLNIAPSILVGKIFEMEYQVIAEAIKSFKPLPHRLEWVASINQVEYYNDSLATNPEATIRALEAFKDKAIILITGGFDRGLDYSNLASKIAQSNLRYLILFPETGRKILENLKKESGNKEPQTSYTEANSMAEAVQLAQKHAQPGDVVLLSPASASFNMFKDYADRGNQFKITVTTTQTQKM